MAKRMPKIDMSSELVTGGDLRKQGNSWIRSSFKASGIGRVPRENQVRAALLRHVNKKNLDPGTEL